MKRISTLLIFVLFFFSAYGQQDSVSLKPFQFSFFYPLSTAGIYAVDNAYLVSLNVLAGVTGAAHGIEIGGISNVNRYYNRGIQIAGISNVNGSYHEGIQFGGICNISGGYARGLQFGGICNIAGGEVKGGQFGGILNISGGRMKGIQGAGIANVAGGNAKGIQVAGIGNMSDSLKGIQAGGIINVAGKAKAMQIAGIGNVADDIHGAQVGGIFNVADNVEGVQLAGIINICDSIRGVPIALISIVGKNGYRRFEVWTSEAFHVNVTYKTGIRAFYTMFSLGYKTGDRDQNTGLGFGMGTNKALSKRSSIELEAHLYQISRYLWMDESNFMYTLRLNYAFNLGKRLALYAGPSINFLHTQGFSDAEDIAPDWARYYYARNVDWRSWVGFNAGVRF